MEDIYFKTNKLLNRKIIVEYAHEIDIPINVIKQLLTTTHRNILNVNFHPTEYSKVYSPYIVNIFVVVVGYFI